MGWRFRWQSRAHFNADNSKELHELCPCNINNFKSSFQTQVRVGTVRGYCGIELPVKEERFSVDIQEWLLQ